MKKQNIYLVLYIPLLLFSDLNIDKISSVLSAMRLNGNPVIFYSENRRFFNRLKVKKSDSVQEANVIIFPNKKHKNKIAIVDSYSKLKSNHNSIGAIYIKKGRTQIIFIDERIKAKDIKLYYKYNKYIIKEHYLNNFYF